MENNLTKELLINNLIQDGYLKTPAIIDAFKNIDRADFIPKDNLNEAYANYPLPIGFSQTISQPLTVAFMLELLDVRPGERILEIGAGSGWQTALLSFLAGENGKVLALEIIPELKAMAEANTSKYGFIEKEIAAVFLADGSNGYPLEAPYDKIIAGAAGNEIPAAWKEQLKVNGRIVAPIKESIVVLDKIAPEEFKQREYFGFSFVPLVKK
ncbi:MAG: protein-L-isoaspartate O-methyltransferase [Candidatus Brennerbacteria bacterium]|nr:protein-L-isoaspartate O-methyltransferase [Candidatus Brennerbacteria bacterium]